jgi:hypothetical protein
MTNRTRLAHTCRTCCYWSELIAKTSGGLLVAMCLAERGPRAWRYTRDGADCTTWDEVRKGAIDDLATGHVVCARVLAKANQEVSTDQDPDAQCT